MLLTPFTITEQAMKRSVSAPQDRAIRQALDLCNRAFHTPKSPAEEARAQIRLAIASLKHAAELRAYNLRCFPGIYRRDRAVCLRSSVAMLELAAKRRRDAAELLAQVPALRKAA